MKIIISAGGQGTKLWPYSTGNYPKQFQELLKDQSLFTYNVKSLLKGYSPKDIYISTKKKYLKYAVDQAPEIPMQNYLIEPNHEKNSGPGWGFATLKLLEKYSNEPYMMVQVDDIRTPAEKFLEMIAGFEKIVKRDKKYITGGQKAIYPTLGVDYLKLKKQIETNSELEMYEAEFIPRNNDYHKTKEMIENFHVVIHCNHLSWTPELMMKAIKEYKPDWHKHLIEMQKHLETDSEHDKLDEIYAKMESGPIETVTQNLINSGYVALLPFKWVDIGTWDSVYQYYSKNGDVYADGQVVAINSSNTIIKSHDSKKLIAVAGLENMIVVDTKDVLLIVPKDKSDKIKDLQKEIEKQGLKHYL